MKSWVDELVSVELRGFKQIRGFQLRGRRIFEIVVYHQVTKLITRSSQTGLVPFISLSSIQYFKSTDMSRLANFKNAFLLSGLFALAPAGITHATPATALPAFPGAEGFGRLASGGRGGDVYEVTTLDDDGPGSLREGVRSARGPRTIVFRTAGTIQLKSRLTLDKSDITIAGQTAPGDGVTLRDYTLQFKNATNIIMRYLRLRLGDQNKPIGARGGDDVLNTDDIERVIVDHCSLSWAIDGTHDLRRGGNFTMQWSIIAESLNHSLHNKGTHAMAASYRNLSGNITLHHNMYSTCRDRHPSLGSADAAPQYVVDFRNNVIYNWSDPGTSNFCDDFINCINNVWCPGPMTNPKKLPIALKGSLPDMAKGYMEGNVFEQREDLTRDNYAALDFHRWLHPGTGYKYRGTLADWKSAKPADLGANLPATQPAKEAMELVLGRSGSSLHRDAVDKRLIENVRKRQGKLVDSEKEVGGWPELQSGPVPADSDHDGMPDEWEKANGLNPNDPSDRNKTGSDGYTNLEKYLNSLCQ